MKTLIILTLLALPLAGKAQFRFNKHDRVNDSLRLSLINETSSASLTFAQFCFDGTAKGYLHVTPANTRTIMALYKKCVQASDSDLALWKADFLVQYGTPWKEMRSSPNDDSVRYLRYHFADSAAKR